MDPSPDANCESPDFTAWESIPIIDTTVKTVDSTSHLDPQCSVQADLAHFEPFTASPTDDWCETSPGDLFCDTIPVNAECENAYISEVGESRMGSPTPSITSMDGRPTKTSDLRTEMAESQSGTNTLAPRKRARQPIPDPKIWAKEETKLKRLKGEAYLGYRRKDKSSQKQMIHDSPKAERRMGPSCSLTSRCAKLRDRKCHEISQEARLVLFNHFWDKLESWGEKKMYICSLVEANFPKQKTEHTKRAPRGVSLKYSLQINMETYRVCQTTFLNTFGLKNSTIRYWVADYFDVGCPKNTSSATATNSNHSDEENDTALNDETEDRDKSIRTKNENTKTHASKNSYLETFLEEMPKLPSHYCRKNTQRLYLQTDVTSKAQFYGIYRDKCQNDGCEPLSRFSFDRLVKKKKLSLFSPKKDQCDTCTAYRQHNLNKEIYDEHVLLKERAREEKSRDKILAQDKKVHVICVDLMAVKLLPMIEASSAYFRMKLAIHNYTVYNLGNNDAYCCWFTENSASLTSSTFATILINEIQRLLNEQVLDVIIYSDGCTNQNRNSVLANALLSVSAKWNITIHQKFLVKGHTQMEADSVHSMVERAMRKKEAIYLPHELVQLTKEARKFPFPYRAEVVYHDYFKNYSSPLRYPSIRPGLKVNDAVVVDLRWIKYEPSGVIHYKLNFDDDFKMLPHRPKNPVQNIADFPPQNASPIPIPKDKWDDLQRLKSLIPRECHAFYDELPHAEISYRKTVGRVKKNSKVPKI